MSVVRSLRVGSGGLACLALLAVATDARALGPVHVEIAGEVGTGTNPIGGDMNPQLGSVGARVGVVYRRVYAGVDFLEEFGGFVDYGDVEFGRPGLVGRAPIVKSHAFGARLGYGYPIAEDHLVVRPQLGIGDYIIPNFLPGVPDQTTGLYLEPGVCVLAVLGHVILGADGNLLILPAFNGPYQRWTDTALTFHLQAGVRF